MKNICRIPCAMPRRSARRYQRCGRKNLMTAVRVEDWNFNFPAAPSSAIPTETFPGEKTLVLNNSTLHLKHHPNAHTDGDIAVTFAEADVLHAGDIYWNGIYPFIDYSTGGGIDGIIRAVEALLANAGDQTIIIPGHGGPVSNKSGARGLSRYARHDPRPGRHAEEADADARGDHCGESNGFFRSEMGAVRYHSSLLHEASL